MKKLQLAIIIVILVIASANLFGQNKTIIGIIAFTDANQGNSYSNASKNKYVMAIQDAVSDAFLSTKRFTLVEREKMNQLKAEKQTQQTEDYIDGAVVEQSKSLGASYLVTGNVIEATIQEKQTSVSYIGGIASRKGIINFNLKVINVETGEIIASEKFSGTENGKNGFEKALEAIQPKIKNFITNNFKTIVAIVSIEDKANNKLLIAGGSALGLNVGNNLKIYEEISYNVNGKKTIRKKELGKGIIEKIEDENFSLCNLTEGASEVTKKIESGAKLKCEILN